MLDFKNTILNYSECLESENKLKGILLDLYPEIENRPKINVLIYAYEINIIDEIKNNELDDFFLNKMRKTIVDNFSVERKAAEWAVKQWCECYGVSILNKQLKFSDNNTSPITAQEGIIKLTTDQKKAVNSEEKRIAVIAGPGSGKTRVLTERICSLIKDKSVKEEEILALSYSSKAAKEMKKRLKERLGTQAYKIQTLTFHSFGLQVIRDNADLLGYTPDFEILNSSVKNKILRKLLQNNNVSEKEILDYSQRISKIKNGEQTHNALTVSIFEEYNKELKNSNTIDFDDMIELPLKLFNEHPEICNNYKNTYSHILIDEVQDLNNYQTELVKLLLRNDASLFVVGDDDQCIYEWRGAQPEFLKNLVYGKNIEVIRLQENFRSDGSIVNIADSLIGQNVKRIVKMMLPRKKAKAKLNSPPNATIARRFYSAEEEATFIASEIRKSVEAGEYNYNDFAILLRSEKQQGFPIKTALEKNGIPYYEQTSDNIEYDEFLNVLYTISNFKKKNGINKAVNYPIMIMDNFAYTEACEKFNIDKSKPVSEAFEILDKNGEDFEDSDVFRARYRLIKELNQQRSNLSVSEIIKNLYELYSNEPFANTKKAKEKLSHLQDLLDIAKDFDSAYQTSDSKHTAVSEFLDYLNLSSQDESNEDCSISAVNLMTCHKSKGLEFPVVFIPGVQVGIFPNDFFINTNEELEAERRLFYVSMTRAINELYITCYSDPFRGSGIIKKGFIAEIPNIRFQEV